jgi:hypothetical protein
MRPKRPKLEKNTIFYAFITNAGQKACLPPVFAIPAGGWIVGISQKLKSWESLQLLVFYEKHIDSFESLKYPFLDIRLCKIIQGVVLQEAV